MLTLQSVSKTYPGAGQILREVSLHLDAGQVLCLAGQNAEGKTTLLEIAAGLRHPDAGEIRCTGRYSLVPQRPALFAELSASDHLALWYAAAGRRDRPFFPGSPEELLGLRAFSHTRAGRLSGGMRQRLSIATSLCCRPDVLLLDEPFSALDPAGINTLFSLLQHFSAAGGAVLFSCHDPRQIAALAHGLLILQNGSLQGPFPLDPAHPDESARKIFDLLRPDPPSSTFPTHSI